MSTHENLESIFGVNGFDLNSARARGEIKTGDLIEVEGAKKSSDGKPARAILQYMEPDMNTFRFASDIPDRGIQNGVHYFLLLPNQPKVRGVEESMGIGIWINPNNWRKVGHLRPEDGHSVRRGQGTLQDFILRLESS